MPTGQYRFFMAVAEREVESAGEVTISIVVGDAAEVSATYAPGLTFGMFEFEFDLTASLDQASLVLTFGPGAEYLVDNVSLARILGSGETEEFVVNRSFEQGMHPWQFTPADKVDSVLIHNILKQYAYGTYQIQLQVTDSAGLQSEPVAIERLHQSCD